jgi:sulfate/thiosulfate transport system ATP-binding protein
MSIEIRNLQKHFGAFTALQGVDLDIEDGELMALLGPSGCGKTTLLRLIAGLDTPDGGSIRLHGRDVTQTAARHRGVGFVFQHYALFRHMNVFENVAFGLRVRPRATRPPEAQLRDKVNRIIDLVQLGGLAQRYPDQLSGGQRQRVALARALIIEPNVLLLDEPFGALDAQVRRQLRRWLRHLHDELHVTSVFVTHDQDEALDVADRIVLLNRGRIEQIGSANQLQDHPGSVFVSRFLGDVNHLPGRLAEGLVAIGPAVWRVPATHSTVPEGNVDVCVRPYDLAWSKDATADTLTATVTDARWLGGRYRVELSTALEGVPFITAEWSRTQMPEREPASGDVMHLKPHRFALFARA